MLRFEGSGEHESSVPSKAGRPLLLRRFRLGCRSPCNWPRTSQLRPAAAGDLVKAVLATDLADGRKILAPQGTALTCSIQRIRRYYNVHDRIELGAFEPAARVEIVLRLEKSRVAGWLPAHYGTHRPTGAATEPARALAQRGVNLGPLSALGVNLWFARFEDARDDFVIPIRDGLRLGDGAMTGARSAIKRGNPSSGK